MSLKALKVTHKEVWPAGGGGWGGGGAAVWGLIVSHTGKRGGAERHRDDGSRTGTSGAAACVQAHAAHRCMRNSHHHAVLTVQHVHGSSLQADG